MKNKVLGIVAGIIALSCAVCSCGNGGEGGMLSSDKGKGDKVTINFWSHYSVEADYQKQLIEEFNKSNDKVEINLNMVTDQYSDMLYMSMTSNDAPDIFTIMGPSMTKKVVQMGWAAPLDEYMDDEFKSQYIDGIWIKNNNVIQDKTYMIPDQMATFRMVYNKDLFKKAGIENPPTTFAELREDAKKITALGGDIKGYGLELSDTYQLDCSIFNGMGTYAIGENHGFNYDKGEFDFSVYKPCIELYRGMQEDGSLMDGLLLLGVDTVRAQFVDGNIGMMPSASFELAIFTGDNAPKFEMGVANWPSVDGKALGKNNLQVSSGYAMCSAAKDKDACWEALKFLSSKDFNGKLCEKAKTFPLYKDSQKAQYDDPIHAAFAPNENDVVWPALVPALKMKGDFKGPVFTNLITDTSLDIDELLNDLSARSNEAFKDAIANGEFTLEDYQIKGFDPANQ